MLIRYLCCSQAQLALAMDGLQLGERQIKVSMAKITPQRLPQPESRIGLREKPRIPPMNLLQVSLLHPQKGQTVDSTAEAANEKARLSRFGDDEGKILFILVGF